ncbi:MAG: CDP-alcohol phosphatidyltransferase family protein [Gemmatimonadota bacterium]|nr:CDP-alcohol phosphatidyltransferase family protein [Gemmatimonadota bacterium]
MTKPGSFFPARSIVPNALTIIRLVLAVLLPFVEHELWWPIFLVALATEFLDGFLARVLNARSDFGRVLDPIADKAFVFSLLLILLLGDRLPLWHLVLIGLRDEIVLLGALTVWIRRDLREVLAFSPRWTGKTATVFQFLYLGWLLRAGTPPAWALALTAGVSLLAGLDYVVRYRRRSREQP